MLNGCTGSRSFPTGRAVPGYRLLVGPKQTAVFFNEGTVTLFGGWHTGGEVVGRDQAEELKSSQCADSDSKHLLSLIPLPANRANAGTLVSKFDRAGSLGILWPCPIVNEVKTAAFILIFNVTDMFGIFLVQIVPTSVCEVIDGVATVVESQDSNDELE
jgi:hypothetical protein